MRIVAVQTGLSPLSVLGGTVTDREFLARIADRGVEVHVLAEAGEPIVEHRNFVPHFWRRRLRKRLPYVGNLDVMLDLASLLRRLPPVDWVRFNNPYAVGIGTLLGAGKHRTWASYLHCEEAPFQRFVDSWLPRFPDLITCLSEDTRRDVVDRCAAADHPNNVVVPLGIDARHGIEGPTRASVRHELGVGEGDVLVLFVGVLTARKGVKDLVRAWRALPGRPNVRLLMIAKPLAEEETRLVAELVREDSRVAHLPGVPYERVHEYFRAGDVFFFPTHLEGFGIVVGEAMAAGLPVLTTRAKGVRTVVEEGRTALVTDVGDVPAMTGNLDALVRDASLRSRLGDAGRRRIAEHFDWERRIDELMAVLERGPSEAREPGAKVLESTGARRSG